MPKSEAKPEMQDNPAEYTTCQVCDTRRKLPETCKCDRLRNWSS